MTGKQHSVVDGYKEEIRRLVDLLGTNPREFPKCLYTEAAKRLREAEVVGIVRISALAPKRKGSKDIVQTAQEVRIYPDGKIKVSLQVKGKP